MSTIVRIHSVLVALCLGAISISAASTTSAPPAPLALGDAQSVQLPDTAPARIAAAWIAMINDPRDESVDAFEARFAAKTRASAATQIERRKRANDLHRQWGQASIRRLLRSEERSIEVALTLAKSGSADVEFRVDPNESGKLEAIFVKTSGPPARPITSAQRSEAIEHACKLLEDQYVMPAVGKSMADTVRKKQAAGEYDQFADDASLASRLTEDMRAICHDLHLAVRVDEHADGADEHDGMQRVIQSRTENQGFRKVEVLDGNIGYLKLDFFLNNDEAQAAAIAAMSFLQHVDALVFDLRQNGGGDPEMIRFLTSWLFDERTHLNDMVGRDGKVVAEYWTLPEVPGKRFAPDLPVYVLTSNYTFSGAEEFSYNLENLKRATVIGETTGGGANPVDTERISDRFVLNIPKMRAQNPITKTNWEGVGVKPDIAVPAPDALDRAVEEARRVIDERRATRPHGK